MSYQRLLRFYESGDLESLGAALVALATNELQLRCLSCGAPITPERTGYCLDCVPF